MIRKFGKNKINVSNLLRNRYQNENLENMYGLNSSQCSSTNNQFTFMFSQERAFDLIELDQLLQSVGWSRRPMRRVEKALDNSLLKVGLWQHDPN